MKQPKGPTPPLYQWNVFSADRHLVATYSTQAAAEAHVASWPALYSSPAPLPTPVESDTGPSISTTSV